MLVSLATIHWWRIILEILQRIILAYLENSINPPASCQNQRKNYFTPFPVHLFSFTVRFSSVVFVVRQYFLLFVSKIVKEVPQMQVPRGTSTQSQSRIIFVNNIERVCLQFKGNCIEISFQLSNFQVSGVLWLKGGSFSRWLWYRVWTLDPCAIQYFWLNVNNMYLNIDT